MKLSSIRLARASDVAAIATVHAASVRNLCARHYRRREIEEWLAPNPGLYRRMLRSSTVFVAERSGRVVAFAAVRLVAREVKAMYVAPGMTGGGIGVRLMLRVERMARAFGIRELRLAATLNAVGFYERLGWRRELHDEPPTLRRRCVAMRKRLRPSP